PGRVRAEPNTLTASGSSASAPNPLTNSLWIRSTRHGSVCNQSVSWFLSRRRWSVVVRSPPSSRRTRTGPRRWTGSFGAMVDGLLRCGPASAGGREVGAQERVDLGDLPGRAVFVPLVREPGVAGTEVHRGDPERGGPGAVRPAGLGACPAAGGADEIRRLRRPEAGQRARGQVGQLPGQAWHWRRRLPLPDPGPCRERERPEGVVQRLGGVPVRCAA